MTKNSERTEKTASVWDEAIRKAGGVTELAEKLFVSRMTLWRYRNGGRMHGVMAAHVARVFKELGIKPE